MPNSSARLTRFIGGYVWVDFDSGRECCKLLSIGPSGCRVERPNGRTRVTAEWRVLPVRGDAS